MKKDSAIIIVDSLAGHTDSKTAGNIVRFIEGNFSGEGDKDVEILDTFPVMAVQSTEGEVCSELRQYLNEDLCFCRGVNAAGQGFPEILDLLDIREVYVAGVSSKAAIESVCNGLKENGINTNIPEGCISYL